jgi:gluconokinase
MVIVLTGVEGSGKTTVGKLLAASLGWRFEDADNYHSPQNIAKMQSGIPLTDEDRRPWLESLRQSITKWISSDDRVVLACSALKQSYRDMLAVGPEVKFVFLSGAYPLIEQRLAARAGHYAHADLLRSQFEALQEPHDAVVIDIAAPPEAITMEIRQRLHI